MNTERIKLIEQRLQVAFSPTLLEISDDSEQHKGHAGSQGGAGHYTVTIGASSFANLTRIDAHRKVYAVLADLIPHQIHALRIIISRH